MGDIFVWSTIILGVWAAVGPLVGVRYGSQLAERVQRQHWLSDNKKQEYRELLSTLSRIQRLLLQVGGLVSGEEERMIREAENETWRIIQDRVFIAETMQEIGLLSRWAKIINKLQTEMQHAVFLNDMVELRKDILAAALKELGIKKLE